MKSKTLPAAITDPQVFEAEAQGWNGTASMVSTVSTMSSLQLMKHALVKLENSSAHQTPEKVAAMQYLMSAISMVSVVTCS
ncbi:MAG: hypothetical protein ACN6PR_00070 [Achromobacter sp.]